MQKIYRAEDVVDALASGEWPPPGHTDPEVWVRLDSIPAPLFERVLTRHRIQTTGVTVHHFEDASDIVYCVRVAPVDDSEP